MRRRNTVLILVLLSVLILAALGGLLWINRQAISGKVIQTDFLLHWTAGNEWLYRGISPYEISVTQDVVSQTSGINAAKTVISSIYYDPMYSLFIVAPFSLIDYASANTLWITFLEICFIVLIMLCIRISGWRLSMLGSAFITVLCFVWFNSARSIILGQYTIIPITLIVIALALILNQNDVGAGFLLALSTAKPDISFLIIIYVFFWSIFTHRKKLTTSMFVSFAFLWLVSELLLPNWIAQWFTIMVRSFEPLHIYHTAISVLARSLPGIKNPINIILHAFLIVLLIIAWVRGMRSDKKVFIWTSLLTLSFTALLGFRVDASYPLLILPAVFLIASVWQARWKLVGEILSWFFILLFVGGSWLVVINAGGSANSDLPAILYILPPFIVLLGLYMVHWWAVRSPQLPFELLRDHFSL